MEYLIIVPLVILLIAGVVYLQCYILTWAFNLIVPLFWVTAPHITMWHSLAILVLLSIVGGSFKVSTTNSSGPR